MKNPIIVKITSLIPVIIIFSLVIFISKNSFTHPGMYFTHDGDMHLVRSFHMFNELHRGQFPVRMSPESAYSFGYEIFQFFYPLPPYIVAVFQTLGFTTTTSWKLMQVLTTTLSLSFFYLWTRCHVNKKAAHTATTLYGLAPFRFLTLYVTGQIGGYYGLMFAPLLALGLNMLLMSKNKKVGGILLSLGVFGMITSHLLSVIIFFIPLGAYTIWLLYRKFSWGKVISLIKWVSLGVGLSAFYFLPFMIEKSWVQLGHQILIDHRDHWPTAKQLIYSAWGYGSSVSNNTDAMSFQIGFSILASWILALIIVIAQKRKQSLPIIFIVIFAFLFFLMTSNSSFVWEIITPLQLIQFPWRLLAPISLVGAWLAGWSIDKLKGKKSWLAIIILILLNLYNVRNYTKPWPLDWREDQTYLNNQELYYGPTDISWELTPIKATKRYKETPYFISDATASGIINSKVFSPTKGSVRKIIDFETENDTSLSLALWDLPVWSIRLNGNIVEKQMTDIGTIKIPVQSGSNRVEVILQKTLLQKISDLISLVSFVVFIFIIFLPKIKLISQFSYKKS